MRRALLIVLLASGCVSLGHPTPVDAERAQARWPGTSVAQLEDDRRVYVARCSGCHALHLPEERAPSAWPKVLDDMQREAKLAASEREKVERFLVVMSSRAAEPEGRSQQKARFSRAKRGVQESSPACRGRFLDTP